VSRKNCQPCPQHVIRNQSVEPTIKKVVTLAPGPGVPPLPVRRKGVPEGLGLQRPEADVLAGPLPQPRVPVRLRLPSGHEVHQEEALRQEVFRR
jgi:hypothetical protein